MRSLSSFVPAAAMVALAGCTSRADPGPIHRCPVADWVRYEEVCTCEREPEVLDRGTMVGLYAPPGSLPPGAAVTIEHGGLTSEATVSDDGSLSTLVVNGGEHDLRGDDVVVRVPGGATYVVPLDRTDEVALVATDDDPRFPERALAIEEPLGTIVVRGRLQALWGSASPITHLAIGTTSPLVIGRWIEPTPGIGDTVVWTGPGREGDPLGFVALHESGTASGCYAGRSGLGTCQCAKERREAHQCRFEIDSGPPDAGPPDAGPPGDAAPF